MKRMLQTTSSNCNFTGQMDGGGDKLSIFVFDLTHTHTHIYIYSELCCRVPKNIFNLQYTYDCVVSRYTCSCSAAEAGKCDGYQGGLRLQW